MTAAAKFLNCIDSALRECLIAIFSNQRAVNIKENYFLLNNKNPFIEMRKKNACILGEIINCLSKKNKKDFEKNRKKVVDNWRKEWYYIQRCSKQRQHNNDNLETI